MDEASLRYIPGQQISFCLRITQCWHLTDSFTVQKGVKQTTNWNYLKSSKELRSFDRVLFIKRRQWGVNQLWSGLMQHMSMLNIHHTCHILACFKTWNLNKTVDFYARQYFNIDDYLGSAQWDQRLSGTFQSWIQIGRWIQHSQGHPPKAQSQCLYMLQRKDPIQAFFTEVWQKG